MTRGKSKPPKAQKRGPREEISAGGVVFRREGAEPRYLLIRDSYRNWGFPKGHVEAGEQPADAALREVGEETGLERLEIRASVPAIDWYFRFRGRLIHKVCHFFLMESPGGSTKPQRSEGITACRWALYDDAAKLLSYGNAREVLASAHALLEGGGTRPAGVIPRAAAAG